MKIQKTIALLTLGIFLLSTGFAQKKWVRVPKDPCNLEGVLGAEELLNVLPIYAKGLQQTVSDKDIDVKVKAGNPVYNWPFIFPAVISDAELIPDEYADTRSPYVQLEVFIDGSRATMMCDLTHNVGGMAGANNIVFSTNDGKVFKININYSQVDIKNAALKRIIPKHNRICSSINVGVHRLKMLKIDVGTAIEIASSNVGGTSPITTLALTIDTASITLKGVIFELMEGNLTTIASATDLEQLVKGKGLKIKMNGQALELLLQDRGTNDRAIARSFTGNKCVIRVVSIAMQRIFDVTVSKRGNDIAIYDIKEISKRDYLLQGMS